MSKLDEALDYALEYAKEGLAVFPCKPKSKTPATSHGCKDATTDEARIREWFKPHCGYNIGIATGSVSDGLIVLDVDVHDNTQKSFNFLHDWQDKNGELPETWIGKTGSGGAHILYKVNDEVKNSVNQDVGIDVRGEGGYIVVPPSLHPNNTYYMWWKKDGSIAHADENVYKFLEVIQKKEIERKNFILPEKIKRGQRNDILFKYVSSLQSKGFPNDEIKKKLHQINMEHCDEPVPADEEKRILESVINRYDKGASSKFIVKKTKNSTEVTDCLTNLVQILEGDERLAGRFFYDVRAYRNKVMCPLPWDDSTEERILTDTDYIDFRYMLENFKNPKNPDEVLHINAREKNCVDSIIKVSNDHKRNRLTEWLDSLTWDGEERIYTLLSVFLGASPDQLNAEVARLIVLGAVARAYKPGTKFDYIPVLVGKQGIGKSEFVKKMSINAEWYLDNLATMEGDGAIEKLENKWIVEVAELANLRRDKTESVKAFITQTQDVYRPKYGRNTQDRKRGCIFIGTTNSNAFLNDPTGNRRWLPVTCGVQEPVMSLFGGKDTFDYICQVWAEGVAMYKAGDVSLVLDPKLEQEAEAKRNRYLEEDPRVGIIESYLEKRYNEFIATFTNPAPDDLRVCSKEIAVKALDIQQAPRYIYSEIKKIVGDLPNWEYVDKRRDCGEYGRQNYFRPKEVYNNPF